MGHLILDVLWACELLPRHLAFLAFCPLCSASYWAEMHRVPHPSPESPCTPGHLLWGVKPDALCHQILLSQVLPSPQGSSPREGHIFSLEDSRHSCPLVSLPPSEHPLPRPSFSGHGPSSSSQYFSCVFDSPKDLRFLEDIGRLFLFTLTYYHHHANNEYKRFCLEGRERIRLEQRQVF